MPIEKLGIDMGGVITCGTREDADTFFKGNHLENPRNPNSFRIIERLVKERFGSSGTYIVSTCGEEVQRKSTEWLHHNNFFSKTGMISENIYFCRTREAKAPICQSLGITHFIDDRLQVLGYLHNAGVQNLYLFSPSEEEIRKYGSNLNYTTRVSDWEELAEILLN